MPHPASTVDPAAHATHDTVLVAAYAAGDAAGAELEAATDLVAGCPACAALHHDLRVIAAALLVMPAPRRPRDFRLTPGQAASLHPAGWRRLFAPFAGPRFAFAAPLGSGLAALGIVGVLLAGPGLPMGGSTASDVDTERTTSNGTEIVPTVASEVPTIGVFAAQDASAAQAASAAPDASAAPSASDDPAFALRPAGQPAPGTGSEETVTGRDTGSTVPVLLASLAGTAAGVVLVALRFTGRSAARTP